MRDVSASVEGSAGGSGTMATDFVGSSGSRITRTRSSASGGSPGTEATMTTSSTGGAKTAWRPRATPVPTAPSADSLRQRSKPPVSSCSSTPASVGASSIGRHRRHPIPRLTSSQGWLCDTARGDASAGPTRSTARGSEPRARTSTAPHPQIAPSGHRGSGRHAQAAVSRHAAIAGQMPNAHWVPALADIGAERIRLSRYVTSRPQQILLAPSDTIAELAGVASEA